MKTKKELEDRLNELKRNPPRSMDSLAETFIKLLALWDLGIATIESLLEEKAK